jgi:hypothetical protein
MTYGPRFLNKNTIGKNEQTIPRMHLTAKFQRYHCKIKMHKPTIKFSVGSWLANSICADAVMRLHPGLVRMYVFPEILNILEIIDITYFYYYN